MGLMLQSDIVTKWQPKNINSLNSCLKSPQIEGQNLETQWKYRTFAVSNEEVAAAAIKGKNCEN